MLLYLFAILLSTCLAFESVCSFTLHIADRNTKEILTRKKRDLDEEDVINRFEMERVSPLYDIIYDHLPPFDNEWTLPGPPPNVNPPRGEFKLELTKRDEEHVVSHTGKRYRENSAAINWWYSVESFTNLTSFNFTESENPRKFKDDSNLLQNIPGPMARNSVTRTHDNKNSTSPSMSLRSNIGTRPIMLLNDTNVPYSFQNNTVHKPRIPSSRAQDYKNASAPSSRLITNNGSQAIPLRNFNNVSNLIQNVPEPSTSRMQGDINVFNSSSIIKPGPSSQAITSRNFTPFETLQDLSPVGRKQDEDHVVSHASNLRRGRGSSFDVLELPTTPRVTVTLSPKMEESESKPNITRRYILLQSGRIVAINVTSVSSAFKASSGSGGSNKPAVPMVYFGSRLKKNSSQVANSSNTISSQVEKITMKAPDKSLIPMKPVITSNLNRIAVTKKPPVSALDTLRPNTPAPSTTNAGKDKQLLTKQPKQKPTTMKSAALWSTPISNPVFTTTSKPTNIPFIVQSSTRPPTTMRMTSLERTTVKVKIEQYPTSKPTRSTFPAETTKHKVSTLPTTTAIRSPANRYTLPPRNIVETIFDVFQPDTSELPFLIVTFDSLKKQFPTVNTLVENHPKVSPKVDDRSRENKIKKSRVEYEDRSNTPKVLNYNINPFQRTSLTFLANDASKPTFPTTTSSSRRGMPKSSIAPPVTNSPAEDMIRAPESNPRFRHEFVRIVTLPSKEPISQPPEESTPKGRNRHRDLPYVTAPFQRAGPTTPSILSGQLQSSTPNRRSRQQQGFHLRNTVGFQTMPPGAFTDRRSIYGLSTTPESSLPSEPPMDKMVEVYKFEPTRRSVRLESVQNLPHLATTTETPSSSRNNRTPSTKKPSRPVSFNNFAVQTKPPALKPHSTTTPKPLPNANNRNSRTRNSKEIGDKESYAVSSTTAKPFRVYYFEPRRKRTRLEESSTLPQRLSTNGQSFPSNPPRRTQTTRARTLVSLPRQNLPRVPTSTDSFTLLQEIPTQPVDRGRRGRSRFIGTTASATIPTTLASSTIKPTKRHRHSPFIWHRPNVGTTTRVPATDQGRPETTSGATPLPARLPDVGNSFREGPFSPADIRRVAAARVS